MSNEFKYGIQGLLMAIGFFAALQIISFLKIISESNKEDNLSQASVTVSAEISIKNTEGKRLFNQNCAACHAVNKRLTGPALAGVEERIPNRKILYEWIRNNQKVLQSGDAYFNTLYKAYDKIQMNHFPNLSDDDIDNILEYIHQYQKAYPLPTSATTIVVCYF